MLRKIEKSRYGRSIALAATARTLFVCLVLSAPALLAQTTQQQGQGATANTPQQPLAPLSPDATPGSGQQSSATLGPDQSSSAAMGPDTHALSGVESLTTGSSRRLTSLFDLGLYVSDYGYTGQQAAGNIVSGATVGATFDAEKRWGGSMLAINYNGSDTYYYPYAFGGLRNVPSSNIGLSLQMPRGRWTFRFRDSVLYSREAGFGGIFTGGPAAGAQSSLIPALQPSLNPAGTILTGFAGQVTNSASAEADYSLTRRTVLTFSGSYGLLDFLTPGYLDSDMIDGRAGYNYSLSSKNTIAFLWEYDRTAFRHTSNRFDTDLVQLSFGRKVTGRLAFQIGAGPELIAFRDFGVSNTQQLTWSVSGSMSYQLPRTVYSMSYFRGVTPGSGVFFGSEANTLTASASHLLTRFWSASLNGGFARNTALTSNSIFAQNFDNWFAGAALNRQIGRRVHLGLSYEYQKQIMSSGACPVASCGIVPAYQVFGVTVNWHPWSKGSL